MWQYTTETIINSNEGKLAGGVRALLLDKEGKSIAQPGALTDTLLIDGAVALKLQYITRIVTTPYMAEVKEKAELDLTGVNYAAGVLRLMVRLREEGRESASFQNAYLRHERPILVECAVLGSDATTDNRAKDIASLEAAVKKALIHDEKYFTTAVAGNKLTLTATDCYIRFAKVQLATPSAAPVGSGAKLTGFEDFVVVAEGTIVEHGSEGNGTVRRLIKNRRIPTAEATRPWAPDMGGKPIPGGQYDQILIEYVTPRHQIGTQVVGALDNSLTSHILFLEKTGAAAIKALIEKIDTTVCPNLVLETAGIPVDNAGAINVAGRTTGGSVVSVDANTKVPSLEEKVEEIGSVQ